MNKIAVTLQRRSRILVKMTKTGAPGKKIQIRKGEENVEWRYEGDADWQVLAPISEFNIGITSGSTPPENPSLGDVWFQTA